MNVLKDIFVKVTIFKRKSISKILDEVLIPFIIALFELFLDLMNE